MYVHIYRDSNGPLTQIKRSSSLDAFLFVCFQLASDVHRNTHTHLYTQRKRAREWERDIERYITERSCSFIGEQTEPDEEDELAHCIHPGALHKETDDDQLMAMAYEVHSPHSMHSHAHAY